MKISANNKTNSAKELKVSGLVQGIGFRPFIYRLAKEHNLNGFVLNQSDGVLIHVEGPDELIEKFETELRPKAPAAAIIESITSRKIVQTAHQGFSIAPSISIENVVSGISPDIGVCEECLNDLRNQERRINYPFINCTNCGPRFSIIQDFPYDRVKTTMSEFQMCKECALEYQNIEDRRFHAQPIACNNCGPSYALHSEKQDLTDINKIVKRIAENILNNEVVAIKGLGGFHLACNAFNNNAVDKLRKLKLRDGKPFAVMFRDLKSTIKHCHLSELEKKEISSWRKPIVLLKQHQHDKFAKGISVGLNTIGAFLPYLPLHYLLFEELEMEAIVLTSGNLSETPICIEAIEVEKQFNDSKTDIVSNNRKIYNRVDDSVVKEIAGSIQIVRRARGYVPSTINLNKSVDGILAVGAELSNTFCIGKGKQAILSQHIGDLKNFETQEFFERTLETFKKLFRFKPEMVVCDMHPNYISTQFANSLGIEILNVQHHHAHCLSVIAEHQLEEPVIGISMDGTGYGTDGNTWGSEIMLLEKNGFERKHHFDYIPLPGGDLATKQPWRSGLSYLISAFEQDGLNLAKQLFHEVESSIITAAHEMIEKNINCPLSCSAGRLFDAVSAILGICQQSTFHAEAPMRLEDLTVGVETNKCYDFELSSKISFKKLITQLTQDVLAKKNIKEIACKFHNTIATAISIAVEEIANDTGVRKVVLSGGTFQNKYLTEKLVALFQNRDIAVYLPEKVPANDGGIALGQLYYAT